MFFKIADKNRLFKREFGRYLDILAISLYNNYIAILRRGYAKYVDDGKSRIGKTTRLLPPVIRRPQTGNSCKSGKPGKRRDTENGREKPDKQKTEMTHYGKNYF
jgi:hypothetical protein